MEEVPRTKKKNTKIMPAAINIGAGAGAGSFGIGGIVLFGGALVTVTIVSALAFKTRRQRRSPADAGNKSRSPSPSPEKQTVNDSQIQSDGVTNMKEMQITPIRNMILEEKQNYDEEDGKEKMICSVVGENQEKCIDSRFEGEEFDNGLEKIMMKCEEQQVVVAATTERKDDGGEKRKYLELMDDENGKPIDRGPEKSFVSIEAVTTIEDVEEEKEKDGVDETNPVNSYGELIDGNRSENEVKMAEKRINVGCVDFENREDVLDMVDHEVEIALDDQEMYVNEEEKGKESPQEVDERVRTDVKRIEAKVDDQKVEKEKHEEKAEEVIEQANIQVVEAAKVEDQKVEREEKHKEPAQKVEERMSTDLQAIEEAKVDDQKVEREEKPEEQKVEEDVSADVQTIEEAKVDGQKVEREEKAEKQESTDVQEIEIPDVQAIEDAKVDDQNMKIEEKGEETDVEVQVKAITEDEFVNEEEKSKEDEITLFQSIKEDEEVKDNKEDAAIKTEVSTNKTMQEESTPEAKISNLKTEEKTEEKKITLSKEQNKSSEYKGGNRASRYSEPEPWNLKLRTWSVLVSIWCLCHWYSELPFPELSLISSFMFILILIRYQNRTNKIKHE